MQIKADYNANLDYAHYWKVSAFSFKQKVHKKQKVFIKHIGPACQLGLGKIYF